MTRLKRGAALAALALTAGLVVVSAGGAGTKPAPVEIQGGGLFTPVFMPLGVSAKPITVMVQLQGDPVTVVKAEAGRSLSKAEEKALKDQLKANQNALKGSLEKAGARVLADYQLAYNGIKVQVSPRSIAELEKLPGVLAVRPIQKMEPNNVRGVPYIGAPGLWAGVLGARGEGIKIAVIDTGIDYTHANFGGPGTAAAFMAEDAKDTLPPAPTLMGPLAPRIKGGIDLVGDDYNASADPGDPALIPHPDPNPLDCNGHGSHVAGSAAGSGVTAGGAWYSGPYGADTINSMSWTIAPGVAPKADLYGVRVFGCAGSTDVTVDAIEWSVANGMDVINMSLGSPFGTNDDPSAVASTNAAKAGVIVVTSAGNSGPSQYITGSPGTGDGAISTAAQDVWESTPGVRVDTGTHSLNGINANGHEFAGPMSDDLVVLKDDPSTATDEAGLIGSANEALGCSKRAYDFNGAAGKIAVARRGSCARVAKAIFGQMGGAVAVIMTNNAAGLPPFEGKITSNPDTGEPFVVTIPFIGVGGNQDTAGTDSFKLQNTPGPTATLTPIALTNANYRGFASFSSGGPRTGDSFLKPDVTAPGVSIISTSVGTGNGSEIISGTSMASPHNAGAAALVRQVHPAWSVADIKAAIVNTANAGLAASGATPFRISRGGTGTIQPQRAALTQAVAYSKGGSKFDVAASFGFEELAKDFSKNGKIELKNNGLSDMTFSVAQEMPQGSPHSLSFKKSTLTVKAGHHEHLDFELNVPAATAGSTAAFREVAGFIAFTPQGGANNGVALRVPYYLVPRALSEVETELSGKLLPGTTTAVVSNKSKAPITGNADFYAWGLEDKKDKGKVSNDIRSIGVQSFPFASATVATRRLLVFAVNTWDRWSNAATNEFDIYVDVDRDGTDDYIVAGVDLGAVQAGSFNGQMAAFVFSTRSPGAVVNFLATAPSDSTTALLPVLSTALCRTGEPCLNSATVPGGRFSYNAVSFDLANGGVDVVGGLGHYNPWNEAITTGGFAEVAPGANDSSNTVTINAAEWAHTPAKGLMIVSPDNKNGKDEAQLIELGKKK